jgi:hypothetical protein
MPVVGRPGRSTPQRHAPVSHFANDQLALIFRFNIESFAGSLNCLFFAGGGDDADVHEAITLLSVNAPNGRLLPYPSHGRALF